MNASYFAKKTKTHGFEGCSNCGDTGYYLQKYSRERFCGDCELQVFPERFYPCVCCRLPSSGQFVCLKCNVGVTSHFIKSADTSLVQWHQNRQAQEWLRTAPKNSKPGDYIRHYIYETITSSGDVLPAGLQLEHVENLGPLPRYSKHWPGFYMGNGMWEKLFYLPTLDCNGIVSKS